MIILHEGGYDWCPQKKRRRNTGRDTQGGRILCDNRDQKYIRKPKMPWLWQGLKLRKSPEFFLEPSNTRISDFQPSGLWKNIFLLSKPPSLWHFVGGGARKWIQVPIKKKKKQAKDFNRPFSKDLQTANKHMKIYHPAVNFSPPSYIIISIMEKCKSKSQWDSSL